MSAFCCPYTIQKVALNHVNILCEIIVNDVYNVWCLCAGITAMHSALARTVYQQLAQLSQRNRAAGCVTFGWVVGDGVAVSYTHLTLPTIYSV